MAITNYERVGKALELLRDGLRPFVARELQARHGTYWITAVTASWPNDLTWKEGEDEPQMDAAVLLRMLWDQWNAVFKDILGHAERSLVSELREFRNQWAHQEPFSTDDAYRALDSAARLLAAISAPQADEIDKMKMELLRVRFDEQVRSEKRRSASTAVESPATGGLKPWREVVNPHADVASGHYQQAEFAADLWQVHLGEGSAEYRDPVEFFRRTYLTESLKQMLTGALRRLAGAQRGGDPVVQLQTNFGGGKTHSMLALYHLFSGVPLSDLAGIDAVLAEAFGNPGFGNPGFQPGEADAARMAALPAALPAVKRVVLVGNKISPGNPVLKPDGTVVRTLWGELAWQLGGRAAFERVRADDERATSPGDALRELMNQYGPCLILIDEWVAYARQLHDTGDLPAGSFETHFTFAQALTESARAARQCLLVISLPASDNTGSPHTQAEDVEVGGARGRAALDRLRNAVGRVEASWRPASAEEGFEIVRRRLFEPLIEQAQFVARDTVAKAYADLYRTQQQEFPPECRDADYERRLKAAYPIHPEVFDCLYSDWSTLVKFQRTRGVLRLMAAVIHSLWEKGDSNPLIQPGNLPIDDPRVQFELTRYLSDNWVPVIEKDVDGPNALPLRLDGEVPNLGKYAACRRVARAIYLGSAPTTTAANRGVEDRRVKLGCVVPGESSAVFGDALRRLSAAATYLYQDGARYWYSTQPTVTKLAEDRAEQLKRDPDKVAREIDRRVRTDLAVKGDFNRIHPMPQSGQDVPDDLDARLVVLGVDAPYSKQADNAAEVMAKAILATRGNSPRLFRNTLMFLAVDRTRLQDLDEAVRRYLAWDSILKEQTVLDLSPHQVAQADTQRASADSTATMRIPEAYQWLLAPGQTSPQAPVEWQAYRLAGQDALAVRASRKLRNDELLVTALAGTRLRMELDRVPLWRGDHVAVRQLVEDFASYLYLPRLKNPAVLLEAASDGLGLMLWMQESFAYADSFDEATSRYRGLRAGQPVTLFEGRQSGLLVRPEVALKQQAAEARPAPAVEPVSAGTDKSTPPAIAGTAGTTPTGTEERVKPKPSTGPQRFHGTVTLDATRVGRDAGRIGDDVIAHLAGLVGAHVTVTLEIEAEIPAGAPEQVVRAVTENSRALKFTSHGFEAE
jgi:predicted AAA+ superfamily ATPase